MSNGFKQPTHTRRTQFLLVIFLIFSSIFLFNGCSSGPEKLVKPSFPVVGKGYVFPRNTRVTDREDGGNEVIVLDRYGVRHYIGGVSSVMDCINDLDSSWAPCNHIVDKLYKVDRKYGRAFIKRGCKGSPKDGWCHDLLFSWIDDEDKDVQFIRKLWKPYCYKHETCGKCGMLEKSYRELSPVDMDEAYRAAKHAYEKAGCNRSRLKPIATQFDYIRIQYDWGGLVGRYWKRYKKEKLSIGEWNQKQALQFEREALEHEEFVRKRDGFYAKLKSESEERERQERLENERYARESAEKDREMNRQFAEKMANITQKGLNDLSTDLSKINRDTNKTIRDAQKANARENARKKEANRRQRERQEEINQQQRDRNKQAKKDRQLQDKKLQAKLDRQQRDREEKDRKRQESAEKRAEIKKALAKVAGHKAAFKRGGFTLVGKDGGLLVYAKIIDTWTKWAYINKNPYNTYFTFTGISTLKDGRVKKIEHKHTGFFMPPGAAWSGVNSPEDIFDVDVRKVVVKNLKAREAKF